MASPCKPYCHLCFNDREKGGDLWQEDSTRQKCGQVWVVPSLGGFQDSHGLTHFWMWWWPRAMPAAYGSASYCCVEGSPCSVCRKGFEPVSLLRNHPLDMAAGISCFMWRHFFGNCGRETVVCVSTNWTVLCLSNTQMIRDTKRWCAMKEISKRMLPF